MKISQTHAPAQGTPAQASPPAEETSKDRPRGGETKGKAFGSAMEKKASEKKELDTGAATNPSVLFSSLEWQTMPRASHANAVETAAAGAVSAAVPPEISALSDEILHALEASGPNEIRIQFDASVFDGLSVTLTREGGALQVSLQTSSPDTARFLEVHAASLAQTLERPERPAYISIQSRPSERGHGGRQGQGGDQGDDREERDRLSAMGDDQ